MDECDLGNIVANKYLKGAIAKCMANAPHGESAKICEDCGGIIPMGRREASPGCTRCVECQREFEATNRTGGE